MKQLFFLITLISYVNLYSAQAQPMDTANISSSLIPIRFKQILWDVQPQSVTKLSCAKQHRELWQETIKRTAHDLQHHWQTILENKNSNEVNTKVKSNFEKLDTLFNSRPYREIAPYLEIKEALENLFVDVYELSQTMDVHAILQDAANLPDMDDQLLIDLQLSTLRNLLVRNKLFSSQKQRMKHITQYYLKPIEDSSQ